MSSLEYKLREKILDFKYKMGNPSAWESYSEEGSEMIRELVGIIETEEDKEVIYKENEEPSLNELFKGEIIESIENSGCNVCIKTSSGKEFNIYDDMSERSNLSCVTEVEVWKPQKTILSL